MVSSRADRLEEFVAHKIETDRILEAQRRPNPAREWFRKHQLALRGLPTDR
jgi:hypothetical protein